MNEKEKSSPTDNNTQTSNVKRPTTSDTSAPHLIIEAALFSAGTAKGITELSEITGLNEEFVRDAIKKLVRRYSSGDSALEIAKAGPKYIMRVRSEFTSYLQKIAPPELPKSVIKTAALIAYHQPVKQSQLCVMLGQKVYEHVKILKDYGLINLRESGNTVMITTSKYFCEYFGIESTNREDIKQWLAERVGLKNCKL